MADRAKAANIRVAWIMPQGVKKTRVEHTGLIFISADSTVLVASPRGIDLNVFRNRLREERLTWGRRCFKDRRLNPETGVCL